MAADDEDYFGDAADEGDGFDDLTYSPYEADPGNPYAGARGYSDPRYSDPRSYRSASARLRRRRRIPYPNFDDGGFNPFDTERISREFDEQRADVERFDILDREGRFRKASNQDRISAARAWRPPRIQTNPLDDPVFKELEAERARQNKTISLYRQRVADFDRTDGAALKPVTGFKPGTDPNGQPLPKDKLWFQIDQMRQGLAQQGRLSASDEGAVTPEMIEIAAQRKDLLRRRENLTRDVERVAKARMEFDERVYLPTRDSLLARGVQRRDFSTAKDMPPAVDYLAPEGDDWVAQRVREINTRRQQTGEAPIRPGSVSGTGRFNQPWRPVERETPEREFSTEEDIPVTATELPTPAALIRMHKRRQELEQTLEESGDNLDPKLQAGMRGRIADLDRDFKEGFARQTPAFQKRISDFTRDPTLLENVEQTAKSFARGATAEGIYAAAEGAGRLLNRASEAVGDALGLESGGGFKDYANRAAGLRERIREALPVDQEFAESKLGQISQGLGQAAGTLPMAAFGPAGLAAASVGQIYQEAFDDAKQPTKKNPEGVDDATAHRAAMKYLPAAALDFLSNKFIIGRLLKPLKGRMTVGQVVKDVLATSAGEGTTEGAQQSYLNQIASRLEGYDPDRPFDQEVLDSILVGMVVGGAPTTLAQGAGAAFNRQRPPTPPPADDSGGTPAGPPEPPAGEPGAVIAPETPPSQPAPDDDLLAAIERTDEEYSRMAEEAEQPIKLPGEAAPALKPLPEGITLNPGWGPDMPATEATYNVPDPTSPSGNMTLTKEQLDEAGYDTSTLPEPTLPNEIEPTDQVIPGSEDAARDLGAGLERESGDEGRPGDGGADVSVPAGGERGEVRERPYGEAGELLSERAAAEPVTLPASEEPEAALPEQPEVEGETPVEAAPVEPEATETGETGVYNGVTYTKEDGVWLADDTGEPAAEGIANFLDKQAARKAAEQPTGEPTDALSESSASSVLQHPPEEIGEAGGGRERVEQGEQGTEAAATPAPEGEDEGLSGRGEERPVDIGAREPDSGTGTPNARELEMLAEQQRLVDEHLAKEAEPAKPEAAPETPPGTYDEQTARFDRELKNDRQREEVEMAARPRGEQDPDFWVRKEIEREALARGWSLEEARVDLRDSIKDGMRRLLNVQVRNRRPIHKNAIGESWSGGWWLKKAPKGYVLEGDRYVFKAPAEPAAKEPVAPQEKLTPSESKTLGTFTQLGLEADKTIPARNKDTGKWDYAKTQQQKFWQWKEFVARGIPADSRRVFDHLWKADFADVNGNPLPKQVKQLAEFIGIPVRNLKEKLWEQSQQPVAPESPAVAPEPTPEGTASLTLADAHSMLPAGRKLIPIGVVTGEGVTAGRARVLVEQTPLATKGEWRVHITDGKKTDKIYFNLGRAGETTVERAAKYIEDYLNTDNPGKFKIVGLGDEIAAMQAAKKPATIPKEPKSLGTGSAENDARLRKLRAQRNTGRAMTAANEQVLELYEAQVKADPGKWKPGDGVGWRVSRNQINRGYRVTAIDVGRKLARVTPVADTGLTVTGGGMEGVGAQWVHVADLVRDAKYTASLGEPSAPVSSRPVAEVEADVAAWRKANPKAPDVAVVNDPDWKDENGRGIRGQYVDGKLTVNAAFAPDAAAVMSIANHEYAHDTLASKPGQFAVMNFANREIPSDQLSRLAQKYPQSSRLDLIEEWLAENAEKQPGVFKRIVERVREWLAARTGLKLTNEEAGRALLRSLRAGKKQTVSGRPARFSKADGPPVETKESLLTENLRAKVNAPVDPIEYAIRHQPERIDEATAIITKEGPKESERRMQEDKTLSPDTAVAIGAVLLKSRMEALASAKPEDVAQITGEINRITAAMQPAQTGAGQQISMINALYRHLGAYTAVVEYGKGLADEHGKKLGDKFPRDAAAQVNKGIREAGNRATEEIEAAVNLEEGAKPKGEWAAKHQSVLAALRGAAKKRGLKWSEIFTSLPENQEARKQELFDRVKANAGLKNLTDAQRQRLAALLDEAWTDLRNQIFRREFSRLVPLPNVRKPDATKVHSVVNDLVRRSNLGLLDNAAFLDALAEKYGMESLSGPTAKRLADLAKKAEAMPEGFQRNRATIDVLTELKKIKGIGKMDIATAIYYAHILSGGTTQAANAMSTSLNTAANLGIMAVQNPGQALDILRGAKEGLGYGWLNAVNTLKTGYTDRALITKSEATMDSGVGARTQPLSVTETLAKGAPETAGGKALKGWATVFRYVGRAMQAVDTVFFESAQGAFQHMAAAQIAATAEGGQLSRHDKNKMVRELLAMNPDLFAAAERQAKAEGLKGLDYKLRVAEIARQRRAKNIGAEDVEGGHQFALASTFNQKPRGYLGIIARGIADLSQQIPPLRLFVPFTNIVANVANESLNYSPLGAARSKWGYGKEEAPVGWEREQLIFKGAVGTLTMVALAADLLNGGDDKKEPLITGRGPRDKNRRDQLRATGWLPYSIKVGDRYMPYLLTPFSIPAAILGNMADSFYYDKASSKELGEWVGTALMGVPGSITSQSFLSGLGQLADIMRGQEEKPWQRLAQSTIGAVIPNAIQQIDKAFSPTLRDTSGVKGVVGGRVPFVRQTLPAQMDVRGRDVIPAPQSSRFIGRGTTDDEIAKVVAAQRAHISGMTRPMLGPPNKKRKATDEEFRAYQRESGAAIERRLRAVLPRLRVVNPQQAQDIITAISREEHMAARIKLERRALANPFATR